MRVAQAMVSKATGAGKLSAADVAAMTFEAIRNEKFYVVTHPRIMATVNMRLEDIGKLQNPRDPFALKEDARPRLDQAKS
jgi:L-asparaginase/Glu-tRNA(Gln) amidotransferase subunit D